MTELPSPSILLKELKLLGFGSAANTSCAGTTWGKPAGMVIPFAGTFFGREMPFSPGVNTWGFIVKSVFTPSIGLTLEGLLTMVFFMAGTIIGASRGIIFGGRILSRGITFPLASVILGAWCTVGAPWSLSRAAGKQPSNKIAKRAYLLFFIGANVFFYWGGIYWSQSFGSCSGKPWPRDRLVIKCTEN